MLRFLTGVGHALAETRSQAQKPAQKDLKSKWPKTSHLGLRPLMLRFLPAPAHALTVAISSFTVIMVFTGIRPSNRISPESDEMMVIVLDNSNIRVVVGMSGGV
ncbi:tRNA-specific 2-thiouridylase mnmA, partial [Lacticaseibacillus paracasei subsp. paracasei Lpp14]